MKRFVIVMLCVLAASQAWAGTQGKKLVQYGAGAPNTSFMREHIRDMERVPFDGVVFLVVPKGTETALGWNCWGKQKFKPEESEPAIADLKATKFQRFTDNFVQASLCPGNVDWFDPDWSSIAYNFACLARIARQGGCKGIMFDPEVYVNYPTWSYVDLPMELKSKHTCEEYVAKARERGRELMRAVNKEFPDIIFLCLHGYSLPYIETHIWANRPLKDTPAVLQAAFYDGLLDAAKPRMVLVDGYESSYGYRQREEFLKAREMEVTDATVVSQNPKAFKKHVSCGFGVWADLDSANLGFRLDDVSKNYFTPAGFRASVSYALDACDKYVWIYNERFNWWAGSPPQPYLEALELARQGPGPGEAHPLNTVIKSVQLDQHTDAEAFAELRKTMTDVFDFPKNGWKFEFDESISGVSKGWYTESLDDSTWLTISIGRFWEEQLGDYDGVAWYRTRFTAPMIENGKQVFLAIGGIGRGARVWLNGKFVGAHDVDWRDTYAFDVAKVIRPGKDNILAVEVTDRGGPGGIWRSVKLMEK